MREQTFIDAYEASRWGAYAAVLSDFLVLFEGLLRPAAGYRAVDLADALVAAAGEVLFRYPAPAAGWSPELESMRVRLATHQLAAPADAQAVALVGGTRIYETLPLHNDMTLHDRELVTNAVRFNFSNIATQIPRWLVVGPLCDALLSWSDARMPVDAASTD